METNYYSLKNLTSSKDGTPSPSGRYKVRIESYNTKKGCWHYTRAIILDSETKEELIIIDRNYSTFYHQWIVCDGKEYLMCSQHYHGGQTCADPETRTISNYTPKQSGGEDYIPYFCWSGPWALSPDGKTLAVAGCYWACPYEIQFYDVANIMTIPYKELFVYDNKNKRVCLSDIDPVAEDFNRKLKQKYEKEHGENFEDDEKLSKEFEAQLKEVCYEIKWNEDNTFAITGAKREGDKIIYREKQNNES